MAEGERTEKEIELLKHLEGLIARDPRFSEEEVQALRNVIRVYTGLTAFGRGARLVIVTLGMLAAGIAAWEALTRRLREWLIGSIGP